MKIVGIVLLSLLGLILFLLLLVLLVPVGVMAEYRKKVFSLRIRFLFLHITILPSSEKQKKKKKKSEKPKKKKEKSEDKPKELQKKEQTKKKKKLSLDIIKKLLTKHLPPILSCFYISTLNLRWDVHAPDAADTAIRYGAASSVVAGFLAILDRFSKRLRHAQVDIFPNYDEGSFEGDVTVSITVGKLLFSGIRVLLDLIKYKVI